MAVATPPWNGPLYPCRRASLGDERGLAQAEPRNSMSGCLPRARVTCALKSRSPVWKVIESTSSTFACFKVPGITPSPSAFEMASALL